MQITLEPEVEKALKRIAKDVMRSPTRQANLVLAMWADAYDKPAKSKASNRRDK